MAPRGTKTASLGLEDALWKAANQLRSNMDAAEYKHVVLGLLFLKYVSDKFEARRAYLDAESRKPDSEYTMPSDEARQSLLDDRDEYTAEGVFWVPGGHRWSDLQKVAKQTTIGSRIDAAMEAIEQENRSLKGVLPKNFNRRELSPTTLGGLIDIFSRDDLAAAEHAGMDVLGRVYEYFLAQFASKEGKNGGEFYTPRSVVSLLVEMLRPYHGRVFDPCCGSGGMFVQAEQFVSHHGGSTNDISVFGQEQNPTTWRLAKMNLAIRGIEVNLGPEWGDSFHDDKHPDLRADFIMANPPFNISNWGGERLTDDKRWVYGTPPPGNANYAWLQHMLHHLASAGTMGVVLSNGSLNAKDSGQDRIRRSLVESDVVECVVALPAKLFFTRGLPVSLWFLTKDKSGKQVKSERHKRARHGEVLFIDARRMGYMESRTHRNLSPEDVAKIADTYNGWRGDAELPEYEDVTGYCKSAALGDIRLLGYNLNPVRYVGASPGGDGSPQLAFEAQVKILKDLFTTVPGQIDSLRSASIVRLHTSSISTRVRLLSEVTTLIRRGITPRYCEGDEPGSVRVLNQKCVRDGRVTRGPSRWTLPPTRGLAERALDDLDILVNSTGVGTLGRTAQWRRTAADQMTTCDSHVTIVRPDPALVDPTYLALVIRMLEPEIEEMAEGSTGQTELSPNALGSLSLELPPLAIQREIGHDYQSLMRLGDAALSLANLAHELPLAHLAFLSGTTDESRAEEA
jgi:type I restriction enzyme M protein